MKLVEELLRRGTYAWCTSRANRYPDTYKTKRGGRMQENKIKSGEMHHLQKGTMLVTLWFDTRQVAVLSLNCNPNEHITVQRRVKAVPHTKDV